ncbi:MAG: hypothetical protein JW917_02405 [Ignavibacteria bacterium]|nr:hypothetical protein [Ignavibacteria bacterium]
MTGSVQSQIERIIFISNNTAIPDFEYYSPDEMHKIVDNAFNEDNPIQLLNPDIQVYNQIPLLNSIIHLAKHIEEKGEIRLTQKGNLPLNIAREIHERNYMNIKINTDYYYKIYSETDSLVVHLSRILLQLSGMTRKKYNKLSLTKAGAKLITNINEVFRVIISAYCYKLNWGYLNFFPEDSINSNGFGFSLILFDKYGDVGRPVSFYSKKYFRAFPFLRENYPVHPEFPDLFTPEKSYETKTFYNFFNYFGFIIIDIDDESYKIRNVKKSLIFNKLIKCNPPQRLF